MKTTSGILIVLVSFCVADCKSHDNNLYKFDPRTLIENEFNLSEIADEVTYIPLENRFPLGVIFYNISFTNNAIYFPSKDIGILKFDREGNYVSKIGTIGRGPGEYNIYRWFSVDDKTGSVYILDIGNLTKVFSSTGQFIRSFSLPEYSFIDNVGVYDSKLFISYAPQFENAKYEWIIFDTLGSIIKKKERIIPVFTSNWGGSNPIYKFENRLYYYNNFTDTVFSILPDLTDKPSFILSSGEQRVPKSKISLEQLMQKKFLILNLIFETHRFIVIRYLYFQHTLVLIDKHNYESFLINFEYDDTGVYPNGGILNDLDGGPRFLPQSYFSEKGHEYMVSLIYPYQLKAFVTNNEFKSSVPKYPEKKKELLKLADSLKETDNPIIMMVRLKK